jgi:hypothetical protein
MKDIKEKLIFFALIYGMWLLFGIMKRVSHPMGRTLADLSAVYCFRSKYSVRQMVFDRGKILIREKWRDQPDFELTFIDLPGAVSLLKDHPGDMIRLLLENKIHKRGNMYFLFKLGYLFGLCQRVLDDRFGCS